MITSSLKNFNAMSFVIVMCVVMLYSSAQSSQQRSKIADFNMSLEHIGRRQPAQCLEKNRICQNEPGVPRCCDGFSCFEKGKKFVCKRCRPAMKRCRHDSWCCDGLSCRFQKCVFLGSPSVSPTITPSVSQSEIGTPSVSSTATASNDMLVTSSPSISSSNVASKSPSPTPSASSSMSMISSPSISASFSASTSSSTAASSSTSATFLMSTSPTAIASITPSASFSTSTSPSATLPTSSPETLSPTPSQACLATGSLCQQYIRPFCCNKLFCTDGKCSECLGIGNSCSKQEDCCKNESLSTGKKYPCISFRCVKCGQEWGINCESDEDCCEGLKCVLYTGSGSRKRCQNCGGTGERCLVDDQCCGRCINGSCF